jgi:hypothetical protein
MQEESRTDASKQQYHTSYRSILSYQKRGEYSIPLIFVLLIMVDVLSTLENTLFAVLPVYVYTLAGAWLAITGKLNESAVNAMSRGMYSYFLNTSLPGSKYLCVFFQLILSLPACLPTSVLSLSPSPSLPLSLSLSLSLSPFFLLYSDLLLSSS